MNRDTLFRAKGTGDQPFAFNTEVVQVFHDMINRSVPYYRQVLSLSAEIAHELYQSDSVIYDFGSSTGALATVLQQEFKNTHFQYIGIDNSNAMIQACQKNASFSQDKRLQFQFGDITNISLLNTSSCVMNYTLQFIERQKRIEFLKNIYRALLPRGCLIISEKCLENDSDISNLFINRHHALKERHGYSKLEIAEKRNALENVLIPLTLTENLGLLRAAGFEKISVLFKVLNFVTLIALK